MLEVDNRVIIPELTHVRSCVTGANLIHSFACPALGIKCDAYPGILSHVFVFIREAWILSSPPKPHAFVSLPLVSKVNIKLINLKDKFTLKNICVTLVSLLIAYLLKLYLTYLLILDTDTLHHYLLLGFIFDNVFTVLYCMYGPEASDPLPSESASPSPSAFTPDSEAYDEYSNFYNTPESFDGLPSESASALEEAEAAGYYNIYMTAEDAKTIKSYAKKLWTTIDEPDFDETYTLIHYYKEHIEIVKFIGKDVSNMLNVKGYFEAIDAGREPTDEEKLQYLKRKNRYLGFFNNKETWIGRKIDFNNPGEVRRVNLEDLNQNTLMLRNFSARLEYLKSLDKKYLTNKGNHSKIVESLLEVDRKHRVDNAELEKSVLEAAFLDIDLNTKKN